MKLIPVISTILCLCAVTFCLSACQKTQPPHKKIVVYTQSSFLASYGPGAPIAKSFEEKTGVKVEMIDAGDASLVLQRLKLDKKTQVDVVLGVDQLSLPEAMKVVDWHPIPPPDVKWNSDFPKFKWHPFLPYDWAPLTFIYKQGRVGEVNSWDDLLKPEFKKKLALQDPRLSTPGLQFLYAVQAIKGDQYFSYLNQFKKSVYRMAPSWSSSYGLFQKGKVNAVFSYLTSPVYHLINEKDDQYKALVLSEGHPVQVELAGVPKRCKNCEKAVEFVHYLLDKKSQELIMNRNVMLPVVDGVVQGTPFADLPKVKTLPIDSSLQFAKDKTQHVKTWLKSIGGEAN